MCVNVCGFEMCVNVCECVCDRVNVWVLVRLYMCVCECVHVFFGCV